MENGYKIVSASFFDVLENGYLVQLYRITDFMISIKNS